MTESTVVSLPSAEGVEDPLTEVLRAGARQLVRHAVEAEVAALLAAYADHRTETGRRRLVRHGHGPEREILTGIGPVPVRRPKVRDRGSGGGGSDTVFLDDPAAFRAADALVGRGAADAVSAGSVERGLRGGAVGAGGSGGVGPVAGCDRSSQIGMGGGARALASPGSLETAVCLRLGGRDLPSGSAGRREAVRSGADRGDAGGPEGTAGVPGGVPGERSELAGTPGGSEGAWPPDPPGTGDRGRGSRLLEGARRELPQDAPPALLGAPDRQRAERVAEGPAAEREAGPAPDLARSGAPAKTPSARSYNAGRQTKPSSHSHRPTHGISDSPAKPGQVSEGGHLPDQGPGGAARVLRLPGGALASTSGPPTPSRACSRRSGIAPFAARAASPTRRRWRWSSSW